MEAKPDWWIFRGDKDFADIPAAPSWRSFTKCSKERRGAHFDASEHEIEMINAALYLRRPLLITGKPGVGKTSLTYAVAHELGLGNVLRWSVTTQSTLKDALYRYDAIARLQDASLNNQASPPIGKYLRLGPLGTAFAASDKPRVLLIDEIDKSDIDLPNDLLHIFEEGEFEIPELSRLPDEHVKVLAHDAPAQAELDKDGVDVQRGWVHCKHFPLVILTSNGEREFPAAFLRRCLQLEMQPPNKEKLMKIARMHLDINDEQLSFVDDLVDEFLQKRDQKNEDLSADQLLNAIFLVLNNVDPLHHYQDRQTLAASLWRAMS